MIVDISILVAAGTVSHTDPELGPRRPYHFIAWQGSTAALSVAGCCFFPGETAGAFQVGSAAGSWCWRQDVAEVGNEEAGISGSKRT